MYFYFIFVSLFYIIFYNYFEQDLLELWCYISSLITIIIISLVGYLCSIFISVPRMQSQKVIFLLVLRCFCLECFHTYKELISDCVTLPFIHALLKQIWWCGHYLG